MDFRDQVIADLPTFLPLAGGKVAEFDELREIDGVQVACVLDETEGTNSADGVTQWDCTVFIRTADIQLPRVGQRLTLGARTGNVVSVDDTQGMLCIRLRWFDS